MDYVMYVVAIVLLLIGAAIAAFQRFSRTILEVSLEAYEALSFSHMIGESAAERILRKGGVTVEQFLHSASFSVFCTNYVPDHALALTQKPFMPKRQWEHYMAFNLLYVLEVHSLIRMERRMLGPEELRTYWTEVESLPEELQVRFVLWLHARENGWMVLCPDGEVTEPDPTIEVIVVRKLPRGGGGLKDPFKTMPSLRPQFAC